MFGSVVGGRFFRVPAVLGGLWLVLLSVAACTGNTDVAPPSSGMAPGLAAATSAAPGVARSTAQGVPASAAGAGAGRLVGLGLQLSDFPAGWVAAPYRATRDSGGANASFAACLGVRDITADRLAVGHSEAFSMGTAHVLSEVGRYPSDRDLSSDRAALGNPKYGSCLRGVLMPGITRSLPAGATLGGLSTMVTLGPGAGGPGNAYGSYTVRFSVVRAGVTLTFFSTTVLLSGPSLLAQLDFSDLGHPVAADLQATLVQVVAARIRAGMS